MFRRYLMIVSLLVASLASAADRATVIQLPNNGPMFVLVYTSSGQVLPIADVTFLKLDQPPTPPNPQEGLAENLIIIRDQAQATTKTVSVLLDLQMKYQKGTKPEAMILDRTEPSATTKAWLDLKESKAPAAEFPYYFVVGAGGRVLEHGTLLDTVKMNERIARYQKAAKP